MSHAHYSIVFRHDLRLMDVAWHRHFAAEDVGPYAQACKAEFTRQGFHPGYLLRMDMSQSAVQPQDAIAILRVFPARAASPSLPPARSHGCR